jgi:hypothetical protein
LLDTAAKLGIDIVNLANHGELTLKIPHPDGTYCLIELMGAHDQDKIEDLRGTQYDLVIVDEAQLIRPAMLESLLTEIIVPGCRARKGAILLIGTPGPVKMGPFYEHWIGTTWRKFRWTAWENPYTPRADRDGYDGSIEKEIADLGLKPTDPRYIREYLGEWYDGHDDTLVWEYEPGRNDSDVILPTSCSDAGFESWRYSWGIDLASNQDNDALVVLGWDTRDAARRLYEVDSWQQPGSNTTDELEKVLKTKRLQWKPACAIGDDGGHGAKKIIRTLAPRLGIVFSKKPTDVEASMRLINTDLRKGRMKVRRGGELAQDMLMEVWEVNAQGKRVIGGQRHSDLTAACRYAYMASYAHKSRGYVIGPTDPDEIRRLKITKDIEAWKARRDRRMGKVRGRNRGRVKS